MMDQERLDHMRGIFRGPLLKLKDQLLMMASLTDRNLTMALNALLTRDNGKTAIVESEDAVIDRLEVEVDDLVVTYVSTHGPMATACRLALSGSKISENLENIADQAVTIARRARQLNGLAEPPAELDVARMARIAIEMMRESIHAFVEVDPEKARAVIGRDRGLDALNREHEEEINRVMFDCPQHIPACVHLLLISRGLERVGDYAKNIAEDVVFLYTARDIRHEHGMQA